jgi:hypothetical protein
LDEKPKIHLRLGDAPAIYNLEVDEINGKKQIERLRSFVRNNNDHILKLATDISINNKQFVDNIDSDKIIRCRLPRWFNKTNLKVAEAIALILYFAGKGLTMKQITSIMNSDYNKIDLKNVSKHLTSKNSDLYGYTTYDEDSRKYDLNYYGKRWIETQLLERKKQSVQRRITTPRKNQLKEVHP